MAEHVAKTTDVDAMLSRMSHRQFDEWCAKDLIEPIGNTTAVCDVLAKIGVLVSAFMGQELTEADFLPWLKRESKPVELNVKQSKAALMTHLKTIAGTD